MSFWCGVLFLVTATFSLNALYHDLFISESADNVVPKCLLGSLYQPVGNWAAPKDSNSMDLWISPPEFKIHHPFTALLPAKQAFEFQIEVPQEETTETDAESPTETGLSVIETGLSVIETGLSVIETGISAIENGFSAVEIIEIEPDLNEDSEEDTIVNDELSEETFQTCPAKAVVSCKTEPEVKEEIQKPVSHVISLGEYKDTSTKHETITSTKKEIHKDQPAQDPIQNHLERDVIILLAAHLTLVISVLIMGCRCLCAHKYNANCTVDVEELVVTVGLISCIVVALFALLGATIILFIRILLAKFP
ncbi:uncharacterized protein [Heterodontus francisci]|uniref:uncharacterized protein n=1 Tax=Heterodontus francisci TaxID=7792 RepID=UPI00355C2895